MEKLFTLNEMLEMAKNGELQEYFPEDVYDDDAGFDEPSAELIASLEENRKRPAPAVEMVEIWGRRLPKKAHDRARICWREAMAEVDRIYEDSFHGGPVMDFESLRQIIMDNIFDNVNGVGRELDEFINRAYECDELGISEYEYFERENGWYDDDENEWCEDGEDSYM